MSNIVKTGLVSNIQKFSLSDGPGIRTIVFFKGCPAKCPWCCNPENISPETTLAHSQTKCMSCGECIRNCTQNAVVLNDRRLLIERSKCTLCGNCVRYCPTGAMEIIGKLMTVKEVYQIVNRDRPFYNQSKGGVTISGGEPFLQFDFLLELLKKLKEEDIHTAIETCGYALWKNIEQALPYTDLLLFDLKIMCEALHLKSIGISNACIHENLRKASDYGVPIQIRVSVIPEYTDRTENIKMIAQFIKDLNSVKEINLLPYHKLGAAKYRKIGMRYTLDHLDGQVPDMNEITAVLRDNGIAVPITVHG